MTLPPRFGLTDWRRQRDTGAYEALKAVKRGPKRAPAHPLAAEHAQLLRDNKRLRNVSTPMRQPVYEIRLGVGAFALAG